MKYPQQSRRGSGSFTLIELVTTVAIIGIISALTIPKVQEALDSSRRKSATQLIQSHIRYAQSASASRHDSTWVVFEVGTNKYSIYHGTDYASRVLDTNPHTDDNFIVQFGSSSYKNVSLTSASFGGERALRFDKFGNASSAGTVVLNSTYTITVEAETGRVSVSN